LFSILYQIESSFIINRHRLSSITCLDLALCPAIAATGTAEQQVTSRSAAFEIIAAPNSRIGFGKSRGLKSNCQLWCKSYLQDLDPPPKGRQPGRTPTRIRHTS